MISNNLKRNHPEIEFSAVESAKVPVFKIKLQNFDFDLIVARWPEEPGKVPDSASTLQNLAGVKFCEEIKNRMQNLLTFQTYVKLIKAWAKCKSFLFF
jgi:poly(A) polymerase Pap1